MKKRSGRDRGLKVEPSGKGLAGHAGAVLLHRTADRIGLVARLGDALAFHHAGLVGAPASDSALWRMLGEIDERAEVRIAKARARVRERVWGLPADRDQGFPWLAILGRPPTGWTVIDLDATVITCASRKEHAAGTYEGSFGFHPLAAWCANTLECLAMVLRPGNAGSNTASEHVTVLIDALAQIPGSYRRRLLIRLDGAGAGHALIEHLLGLSTTRRKVAFTSGFTLTALEEHAIALLPEHAWTHAIEQDGGIDPVAQVAELTGPWRRTGWPDGLRHIARRVKPSRRHAKKPTEFESATGRRYRLIVTNIDNPGRTVPGSHHVHFLDTLHRHHAVVEDRVRTDKAHRHEKPALPRLRARPGPAAGREHSLRPARLPSAPRPGTGGRTRRSRARDATHHDPAHSRATDQPRPSAHSEDRTQLAPGENRRQRLGTPRPDTRPGLTCGPDWKEGETAGQRAPANPGDGRAPPH